MYSLFTQLPLAGGGVYKPGQWPTLSGSIRKTVEQIVTYYHDNPMAVTSQHFLNKILAFYGSQYQTKTADLYREVQASALNLAMGLKMTAPTSIGHIFPGVFYGPGIKEILIASTSSFDWDDAAKNWKTLQPVKVLQHPFCNTAFNLPDGFNSTNVSDFAVISIDIPMLIIQYHGFRRYEQSLINGEYPDYVPKNPYQFIHMHVLPNMMYSHVDNVIINRFRAIVLGLEMEDSRSRHSFYVTRWGQKIDDVLYPLAEVMKDKSWNFGRMLKSIPLVFHESAYEFSELPKILPVRQVNWALSAGRLNLLEILFALDKGIDGKINATYTQQIQRYIDRYRNDGVFRSVIPNLVKDQIARRFDELYIHKRF